MLIDTYFREVESAVARSHVVLDSRIVTDKRSLYLGLIEGTVSFLDGSTLHFMEFVNAKTGVDRFKYSYHYQNQAGSLIFRYDMAPHCPEVNTFPHHKHCRDGTIIDSESPALHEVLNEVADHVE